MGGGGEYTEKDMARLLISCFSLFLKEHTRLHRHIKTFLRSKNASLIMIHRKSAASFLKEPLKTMSNRNMIHICITFGKGIGRVRSEHGKLIHPNFVTYVSIIVFVLFARATRTYLPSHTSSFILVYVLLCVSP